ncbi:Cof-type HAD-IIB family hydrolase [Listeria ivanovii]|uniref:Cof-type HAD-IIB family hydrolase n=1 Tax=Listeria ivanovii TaxID=1638 RepID=UPI000DA83388|nr:Cof-type HAD-IIB family hydrolase [Listeria ivanovii]PZG31929.1 Cof-type HAD-IIB family hydrolase [Listeria ivanovii]PZG46005.1 Cof-type HAD-IIB family hydrolase [Listeria ivanovii]PZH09428.1 Cof-type HAD-IIB family hydrolase [Listeria ivanovii]
MTNSVIDTVITDMDGTLLVKKGDQIHPLNKEVLMDWQQNGNKLFLATGRLDLAILPFIHELKIKTPVISCNGGLVRDFTTGEILYKSNIELDLIKTVLETLQPLEVNYHIYTTERIIGPTNTGKIAFFNELNKSLPENEQVPITLTKDPFGTLREGEYPLKVLVIESDEAKRTQIKAALQGLPLSVLASASNLIDIMNEGIDKAKGITYLAENGYIHLESTIAFGDNENDVGMIELAKIGVAMENGIPLALEKADKIAKHHDIGGLGLFMQEEIL